MMGLVRFYETVAEPVRRPLRWLVRFSGWPATRFSRVAAWLATIAWEFEQWVHIVRADSVAGVALPALLMLGFPFILYGAMLLIDRVERASETLDATHPLGEQIFETLGLWVMLQSVSFLTGLLILDVPGMLTSALVVVTCCWIPCGGGGGKSAWARLKERVRAALVRPVGVGA